MSSPTDQLPPQPRDSESSSPFTRFREARASAAGDAPEANTDGDVPTEKRRETDRRGAEFTREFGAEIRSLLQPAGIGLFGRPISDADPLVSHVEPRDVVTDDDAEDVVIEDAVEPPRPTIFLARAPEPEKEPAPVGLSLPRDDRPVERPAPVLSGLARSDESDEPATVPNLFVSSAVAPAEVAFVAAEEVHPSRYRWLLVLLGLLAVIAAAWLAWLASSGDTVDAPVTTVEQITTTVATTSSSAAPPTTLATTTPTTVPTSVESSVSTTVATSVAPPVAPTTPRRPATTSRPRTTAAPTTAAPTTSAAIPELTLPPPTAIPTTTTAAPTTAAPTTAAPTTAAPTTAAPTTAAPTTEATPAG